MKKLLYVVASLMLTTLMMGTTTSCRFAPTQDDGDTVAANVFYPEDTTMLRAKKGAHDSIQAESVTDSVGIYYIGSGSTKEFIQLVSYPSRRDTLIFGKTRHVRVKGCADINHVVRVQYYLLNGKDSLVKYVEEVVG